MPPGFPASPLASAPALAVSACPPSPSPPTRLAAASGNRCGHVPGAPRFDRVNLPEDANHARPVLIGQAMLKLKAYYGSPREARWDELSQGERQQRLARQLQAGGGPATAAGQPLAARRARWRQQRSERREAVVSVLLLLLAYTDIETLTVAVPRGGDWLGLSGGWIAARTGLSASRVKRALATLSRTGLLAATGAGRRFDARRRRWVGAGWGPVRRLSFQCVRMIGLAVSWQQEQRRRRKERVKQARTAAPPAPPPPPAAPAAAREHVRALRATLAPRAAASADPAADLQSARERARRAAELAAQGLSPAEIRRRLADPQPP